ncbi:MAG: excinuclease ABC subunit UvrA [Spirochaetia bacterium]
MKNIIVKGAREHNLKNIDLVLPRDSLIVISGLSGSGKSSLAFDTIFAEGQRRYVESLSAYARQFLGRMEKPAVDYIEGLSPAISIEQKTTQRNPRSTVGTVTEIHDYLRLIFARIGKAHCPSCGKPIRRYSVDQIIEQVRQLPPGEKLQVLAPVVRAQKGRHEQVFRDALRAGFLRVRVDSELRELDEEIKLEKNKKHSIEILVDRIRLSDGADKRLTESIETALSVADGTVLVEHTPAALPAVVTTGAAPQHELTPQTLFFSQHSACPDCNISLPEVEPRLFSFNNPAGACGSCSGLGKKLEFDPDKVIPDWELSFNQGGIVPYKPSSNWYRSKIESLAKHYEFNLDTPLKDISETAQKALLYGSGEKIDVTYINKQQTGRFEYQSEFPGILGDLKRRYLESSSDGVKEWLEEFMAQQVCPDCDGKRLRPEALAVRISGKNIYEVSRLSVADALQFFEGLKLSDTDRSISEQALKEITARLGFMNAVGLEYLSLERSASTLSGGEAQRIRLATQIGSSLVGVLYILDEPTIGLHQRDNARLIETLLRLRNIGNTVIVVEHDEQVLRTADYIVDLGPAAGVHGGEIVAQGSLAEVMAVPESLTGQYLSGASRIPLPASRRPGNGSFVRIKAASLHNLKDIDVSLPVGCLCVLTGVSGSGKSTLLNETLLPMAGAAVRRQVPPKGLCDSVEGIDSFDSVISIDQSPIGRTPRSNPATYVGIFTPIRELFAAMPESRARGYEAGRFSFNVKGGRCEHCRGDGVIKIEMHFLPDVFITCDVCKGKRYTNDTREIRYKGKSIDEVLDMTVEEAREFFTAVPQIKRRLDTMHDVGLDYIRLGQSALTLSGGEAQRVKLSLELSKRNTGRTLYSLDEPTTGLHFEDVRKLIDVLNLLVENGNTIVVIEHNPDVILQADYVLDLGPEGGERGGSVVAAGTPERVAEVENSYTGHYLSELLKERTRLCSLSVPNETG